MAHTSPHIHHINTPLWIRSRLPTRTPSIALTLILRILEYPLSLVYELCKGSKFPYPRNPAIRIDNDNPAGVYFFTHALTTYRRLHDMYSATFKRKPSEGVSHDLTNHTSLASRFIAYSSSICKEFRSKSPVRPQMMCVGFPSPPSGCYLVHRATVPSLSQAHLYRVPLGRLLTLPTNTRN